MPATELVGAAVLERDASGSVLWTWVYPSLSEGLKEAIKPRAGLSEELDGTLQTFVRIEDEWIYILSSPVSAYKEARIPKAISFSIVLRAREFNPEKYFAFGEILAEQFVASGDASSIVAGVLNVVTRDNFKSFECSAYPTRDAYLGGESIKAIISKFGLESILIYTALLLKRRVLVVGQDTDEVLAITRALPQFVWHRQDWDIMYPLIDPSSTEDMALLSNLDHYVAGCTDYAIEDRDDVFDILVDVSNDAISISPHSQETFTLGKIHKEIAMALVGAAQDEDISDMDAIKLISQRTTNLLESLEKLAHESAGNESKLVVSADAIKERKMAASMQSFLINLAAAEDMLE